MEHMCEIGRSIADVEVVFNLLAASRLYMGKGLLKFCLSISQQPSLYELISLLCQHNDLFYQQIIIKFLPAAWLGRY